MDSKYILALLGLLDAASLVGASCAYGTSIHPRAEGAIEVNTFGYTGEIVSLLPPLSSLTRPDPSTNTR